MASKPLKPDSLDIEVAAAILHDIARLSIHSATADRLKRVAAWLISTIEEGASR